MNLITRIDDERLMALTLAAEARCDLITRIDDKRLEHPVGPPTFFDWRLITDSLRAALARFTVPIVCMCGSTRFKQTWIAENARLTGEGYIVLAVALWGHHERKYPDAETKKCLDELHLRKIDLCDWVWVLDVGGYIGESTRNEIAYAEAHGKIVRYLSKEFPDYVEPVDPILARAEKAETGSFRVDAGIERFLQRWDFLVKGRGRQASIMIDVLEDVVATLRTQRRGQ